MVHVIARPRRIVLAGAIAALLGGAALREGRNHPAGLGITLST
jgi:hypothetical protein